MDKVLLTPEQSFHWRFDLLNQILDGLWEREEDESASINLYQWYSRTSNDTLFELYSNGDCIGVLSRSEENSFVMLRIIRMIIDNNHDLLNRDYDAFIKEREVRDVKNFLDFVEEFEYSNVCRVPLDEADMIGTDLWNIGRVMDSIKKDF